MTTTDSEMLTYSDLRGMSNGNLVLIRLAFNHLANDTDFSWDDRELAMGTVVRVTRVLQARGAE